MADAKPGSELLHFVIDQYDNLKPQATDTSNEKITAVIALIDTLFNTFKNSDSTHDATVGQLVKLQAAYTELESRLDPTDYPRYANASANLKIIADELKEKEKEKEKEQEQEEEEGEEEEEEEEEE